MLLTKEREEALTGLIYGIQDQKGLASVGREASEFPLVGLSASALDSRGLTALPSETTPNGFRLAEINADQSPRQHRVA